MFDFIQKNKRLAQVVLVLMVIPFAFFGLESYTSSIGGRDAVATVDGMDITQREFGEELRLQQERLRTAFGRGIDADALDTPETRRALLDSLLSRHLLANAALRARLTVSDSTLRETIAAIPAFQADGAFSKPNYEALLRAQSMTPQMFESRMRYDMSLSQLTRAIGETAIVSRSVDQRLAALQAQRREVAEALVAAQPYLAQVKITGTQLRAYYEANPAEFRIAERVRAEFLVLSAESLARRDPVDEAELRAAYEARAAQYRVEEQRRASHILVKTREEAERYAAEARKSPASFAELAKKHSQDPGSAQKGGDLGFFGRGMMVPAFEQAAFRQQQGEVGSPVQSDFGWHVIRVTGIQAAKARAFGEVRAELAAELERQKGSRKFAESAEAFSNMVYEQSDSLKPAAERFKLALQTSGWITRAPAAEAGVLANAKLLGALFAEDSIKTRRNTDAVEVAANVLVAARVLEHQPQAQRKFEEVRAAIEENLRAAEAAGMAHKAGEAKLAALRKGVDEAVSWGAPKAVSRRSPQAVPAGAMRQIMSADGAKLPAYAGAARGAEGYMLYRVSKVLAAEARPEPQRLAEVERARQLAGSQQLESYVASLRARADIEIHSANLEKTP